MTKSLWKKVRKLANPGILDFYYLEFCFSYVVERVDRSSTAQADVLMNEESDLTLFVRDAQLLEYIILRCVMKNS